MNSFNILEAIKVNAAALADTSYNEEAEPYIRALSNLFDDFTESLKAEKAASDAGTPKAAEKSNTSTLSDNDGDLSSIYFVGQKVHAEGKVGIIYAILDDHPCPYEVGFPDGSFNSYEDTDILPVRCNMNNFQPEPQEIGHCEICGWPIYEGDIYEYTESGLRHCDCKPDEKEKSL